MIQSDTSRSREVVIPGTLIKGDRVRPNPWNYDVQSWFLQDCTYERKLSSTRTASYSGPSQFSSIGASFEPPSLSREIDNAFNDALSSFNEKVNGTLNVTVDLIQAKQTAGLFNATNRLVQTARTFRRSIKDPKKWRQVTRRVGSMWLEWQYGWYPTIKTIHGLIDEMGGDGGNWVRPIRTGSSKTIRHPNSTNLNIFGLPHECHVNMNTSIRLSMCGKVKLTGSDQRQVASTNPAVIAWELLPLSFVVDWLVDIGGYLSNMEAASNNAASWQFGHYSVTTKTEGKVWTMDTAGTYSSFQAAMEYKRIKFVRRVLDSYPTPTPPRLNVDLGANRMLSAAALLSQLLR